ncbi:glycosyltransferase family 1 protein [Bdellovibrio reynosensis]|uniref:Glycosyltransferase family 1 protein n=1 Tax=Bdellovibrio reynosensis TaxID=2835041 RepID=A0ABY4CC78_9BACT|nr:glycosyltransferase family 1 protein [Bdellovibrio reynosensis]UOF01316.1 glycosyltransferase family 1 protein [Bdellovibrio reynosensis]
MNNLCESSDLLVFSHLRWNFVFQRPQHLMSRFANFRRVYFIEEPVIGKLSNEQLDLAETPEGVTVVTPRIPEHIPANERDNVLALLVDQLLSQEAIEEFCAWYYTPMALNFSRHLRPDFIIYDCMDELSHFKGAPEEIVEREMELLERAELVFTGGQSLFEAKRHLHHNIHPFPSGIDVEHFKKARTNAEEPEDQKHIPHPRLGYVGVIDERMDIELLRAMASLKPEWQFVMIGPIVKIDPASLPQAPNIHYLGMKNYATLPSYLSGWDCALMPFAKNDSTRFISPTKTPEYLAAGCPVVSTSIRDVVEPYGSRQMVAIADDPKDFVIQAEQVIKKNKNNQAWQKKVDHFLSQLSWDETWKRMSTLESNILKQKRADVRPSKVDYNLTDRM